MRKLGILTWSAGWGLHLFRLLLANLVLGGWVLWQMAPAADWFQMDVWQRILNMSWLVGTGVLLYLLVLVIGGLRLHHLRQH